ncbi:MAG: cytochrome P450, partial [Candidatus Heimdallarchaeota archaeon]|nr:cytochrome P450 [Candidatus Heimdallarchaeota archaeon]
FETPAKALSFTINEILRNEKIMSNLFDEFNQMGKYQTISVNDLENATYLHGCLKEALRLYPPIWLQTRKNNEEVIIDNVHIPKGSIILMPQYMIHRDPKYWEHPNEFRPERFLQEKPLKHPFSFFPFGGGPSRCVGNQFAFQMIPLVIHNLLTEFDIQLLDKNKPIRIETGITMYPKDGLNVIMKRKLNDTLNNNKPNKGKDNKIILEKEIIE